MLEYPNIDPVIFQIGPLAVRWYSVAYIAGIVLGCLYADYINKKPPSEKNLKVFDDFMTWVIGGIIIGGRLGYVLFYNLSFYIENPVDIIKVWHGGMSFHGGLIGVITAIIIFCRKYKVNIWHLLDLAACVAPIGLFFGRMANFINGELYGRVTDSKWGMIFPGGGPLPRYPSQLFEALLEGLLLFTIMAILVHFTKIRQYRGALSGIFLIAYGTFRILIENFREPDEQIGFLFDFITTGQLLSLPMILIGVTLTFWTLFLNAGKK